MKKVISIVISCALLLGLMSVVSFADTYSREVALLGVLQDGATETVTHEADGNGGVTITQNNGWMPWVTYYTEAAAEFSIGAGETLYLVYDFTVPSGTNLQITLNGWNNSVSAAIAGANAGVTEEGAATIPTGTYTGAIPVNKSDFGDNGRIGIVGTGVTIRTFKLAVKAGGGNVDPGTSTPSTPSTPETPVTPDPGTEPVVGSTLDLLESIGNGSDESDTTEIKDNGSGFVIAQTATWNVWVLYYNELAPDFVAAAGNDLYLAYDMTLDGDGHLCLNGWSNSVAAAIAAEKGADTTFAEDGTPMLLQGTYTGMIKITPDTIGENGRLGIVGRGATIRKFQLVTSATDVPSTEPSQPSDPSTPSAPEPSGDTPADVVKGDADGDNEVTMKDVLLIRKFIAKMVDSIDQAAADVNHDGDVDMKDILLIRKFIAHVILSFDDGTGTATTTTAVLPTSSKVVTTTTKAAPTTTTTKAAPTTTRTPAATTTRQAPTTQAGTPYITYNTNTKNGSLGVWWWHYATGIGENNYKPRLDFLQSNHVTEIYYSANPGMSYADLANFIREAGARGMRVSWLSGDASWIQSGNTGFDGFFASFKNYQNQAAADAKFYGIHLDVEPHQIGNTDANWQLYSNLVLRATKAAHDYGTLIEWDIPFWLEDKRVTANGVTTPLLNVLAANSDTLVLMSYRDTAAAILDVSSQEIPLGTANNCKIVLGVECRSSEASYVSFMEDGKQALCNAVTSVLTTLSGKSTLGAGYGCAVHYVDTWMNLQN